MINAQEHPSKWDELRRRAEVILSGSSISERSWSEKDILHLIHELEVHQVELEIQGEELRTKNQELEELLHRYTNLYHNAPIAFISLNVKGVVVDANHAAVEMLGFSREKLRNLGFSRFIHIDDQKEYFAFLSELNRIPSGKCRGELRLLKGFATPFHVHMEIVPVLTDKGRVRGWLVAFFDISRRKNAEAALQEAYGHLEESQSQLKNLSSRLLVVQEEERKRIARELHDSFGQTLAAMKFSIENALQNNVGRRPEEAFLLLERLVPILCGAIDEVRNIYTGLRPTMLDDLGIVATLKWFCRQFMAALPGMHIELATEIEEKDIPNDLKTTIYRIVQEALNNVAKHSQAEWVDLSLLKLSDGIELTIEDSGVGFDLDRYSQQKDPKGMGLLSMRERAELSGGTLTIRSAKGHGTIIQIRWPLTY